MTREKLIDKLLETGVVKQNEFFDKYIDLIINNGNTKKQKFQTQLHHIIPRCFFNHHEIPIDNTDDNLVNLLYKDHLLAHYYLSKCGTEVWFVEANSCASYYIYNCDKSHDLEEELIKIQELYPQFCEFCSKNGKKLKGRIQLSRGLEVRTVSIDEVPLLLKEGFEYGNNILKNKRGVTKDGNDLVINKEDLDYYLSMGYKEGHSHKTSQVVSSYRTIHLGDNIQKRVPESELDSWLERGFELGVKPTSGAKRGWTPWNKGTKGLQPSNSTGTTWVHSDEKRIRVLKTEVDDFLKNNPSFKKGMK